MNLHVPHHLPHIDRDLLGMLTNLGGALAMFAAMVAIDCVSSCDTTLVTG